MVAFVDVVERIHDCDGQIIVLLFALSSLHLCSCSSSSLFVLFLYSPKQTSYVLSVFVLDACTRTLLWFNLLTIKLIKSRFYSSDLYYKHNYRSVMILGVCSSEKKQSRFTE